MLDYSKSKIDPTARIEDGAVIGEGASIGPYCMIGPDVVIGPGTCKAIRHLAMVRPLGPVPVRGKEQAVEAFVLEQLEEGALAAPRNRVPGGDAP